MTNSRVALGLFGVAVALILVVVGGVAAYQAYALRDFRSWDEKGPPPVASALYYADGPRVTELMMTTLPGTNLADIADMSIFGPAIPGLPPAEFARRYGEPVLHTGRAQVQTYREVDASPLMPTLERWVLHATPEVSRLSVEQLFHPAIAGRITRARLSGSVHLHNGSSTGFLTCTVTDGKVVTSLRWHGAA